MSIWQLCANLLIPNCLRSNLSYSPLAALELYVNESQIQFVVSYNMMNVRSDCFLQTIDKNRINNYAAEFKQYEKDLAAYKKEHGIK